MKTKHTIIPFILLPSLVATTVPVVVSCSKEEELKVIEDLEHVTKIKYGKALKNKDFKIEFELEENYGLDIKNTKILIDDKEYAFEQPTDSTILVSAESMNGKTIKIVIRCEYIKQYNFVLTSQDTDTIYGEDSIVKLSCQLKERSSSTSIPDGYHFEISQQSSSNPFLEIISATIVDQTKGLFDIELQLNHTPGSLHTGNTYSTLNSAQILKLTNSVIEEQVAQPTSGISLKYIALGTHFNGAEESQFGQNLLVIKFTTGCFDAEEYSTLNGVSVNDNVYECSSVTPDAANKQLTFVLDDFDVQSISVLGLSLFYKIDSKPYVQNIACGSVEKIGVVSVSSIVESQGISITTPIENKATIVASSPGSVNIDMTGTSLDNISDYKIKTKNCSANWNATGTSINVNWTASQATNYIFGSSDNDISVTLVAHKFYKFNNNTEAELELEDSDTWEVVEDEGQDFNVCFQEPGVALENFEIKDEQNLSASLKSILGKFYINIKYTPTQANTVLSDSGKNMTFSLEYKQ